MEAVAKLADSLTAEGLPDAAACAAVLALGMKAWDEQHVTLEEFYKKIRL